MQLQHPALSQIGAISHGFFTRRGGTSNDTYDSLNCGYGSDDDRDNVTANRARVAMQLGVTPTNLLTAHQIHSPDAAIVNTPFDDDNRPRVDALVTKTPGIAVAVLTADCGPLLFADQKNQVVGAAHAGWKGAVGGVIENTLAQMEDMGAERAHITAILGPTISRPNYEVDDAFKTRFVNLEPEYSGFFSAGQRDGHHQFDLPAFIMSKLTKEGVGTAINLDRCTYGEPDEFFSYRRATHKNEPDYGRQITAIAITD